MIVKTLNWSLALIIVAALVAGLAGHALAQQDDMVRVLISFTEPPGLAKRQLVESLGGTHGHSFHIVPAMAATVPRAALDRLRSSTGVTSVGEDGRVWATDQHLPWGVDRIDADMVRIYNKGAGVRVAIVDTGIDLDHPDLHVAGGATFVGGTSSADDDNGHGTHVAGIVAALDNGLGVIGVAPEAALYAVKVLNHNGEGYTSDLIRGIEWAVDNNMQVVNMSLAASGPSTELQQACDVAFQSGVILVSVAGNSGNPSGTGDNVPYPARYDSVIAVASTDSSDSRASDSGTGPAVELAAPGVSIYSTCRGGTYCTKQGTSMASAHVAGVAALVIASGIEDASGNGRVNDEVRQRLQQTADDLGAAGRDTLYGYGLVDANQAAPLTVSVPAISPWACDTGLNVTAGQRLYITATGAWTSGMWTGGPSGNETGPAPGGDFIMPDANAYSLIGKIAYAGAPFFVGADFTDESSTSGRLYLGMNDDPASFDDNSGSLTAVISLGDTAPSSAPPPAGEEEGTCFIATAAYGSYMDSSVETLRSFRDSRLVSDPVGSGLVSVYYQVSPPVARFLDGHADLKPAVRAGLLPAVGISTVALSTTFVEKLAITAPLLLVSVALAAWWTRGRSRASLCRCPPSSERRA